MASCRAAFLLLACTLLPACSGSSAPERSPAEARRYWATDEGTVLTIDGTRSTAGRPVHRSRHTTTVRPATTIDGNPVLVYETDASVELPDGRSSSTTMTTYQYVDDARSCMVAVSVPRRERQVSGCTYVELEGPVVAGKTWAFSSPGQAGAGRLAQFQYEASIDETDLALRVGDRSFGGCIRTSELGIARPEFALPCSDGSQVVGRIEKERTRWLCPGLGVVRETSVETYVPTVARETSCYETRSEFEVVNVEPGSAGGA